jgi:hypothetical protein
MATFQGTDTSKKQINFAQFGWKLQRKAGGFVKWTFPVFWVAGCDSGVWQCPKYVNPCRFLTILNENTADWLMLMRSFQSK